MAEITLYSFEDAEGNEETFTTLNYDEAREHAIQHQLRLIAQTYEYTDQEMLWDYTGRDEDEEEEELDNLDA
jgi:hypothetical protein